MSVYFVICIFAIRIFWLWCFLSGTPRMFFKYTTAKIQNDFFVRSQRVTGYRHFLWAILERPYCRLNTPKLKWLSMFCSQSASDKVQPIFISQFRYWYDCHRYYLPLVFLALESFVRNAENVLYPHHNHNIYRIFCPQAASARIQIFFYKPFWNAQNFFTHTTTKIFIKNFVFR